MDTQELKKLYDEAKEAYYNGDPIMSDAEFDELEAELGLENQGYIGEHHSANFTVKHPYIMGSLSKVQIKRAKDGSIDWEEYAKQLRKYINYNPQATSFECTPKYDGCSFEALFDNKGKLLSASTRGDGQWGKDITPWFEIFYNGPLWNRQKCTEKCARLLKENEILDIRGEILIDKSVFQSKYADKFANPRSFIAGTIGRDYAPEFLEQGKDLHFTSYDYRTVNLENGAIKHIDYSVLGNLIDFGNPNGELIMYAGTLDGKMLEQIYQKFEDYRAKCPFTLDGVVFKTHIPWRRAESIDRPKDCAAMKFLPEIVETTIKDVEWSLGKTGELFPVAIFENVTLDNKDVTRASLHNYGFVVDNGIGIGSRIRISLAGDIIPYIYEVIGKKEKDFTLPADADLDSFDGTHLMKIMSGEDLRINRFVTSCRVLNIEGIGPKIAGRLASMHDKFHTMLDLMVMLYEDPDRVILMLNKEFGDGDLQTISKTESNILDAIKSRMEKLTVKEVIGGYALPVAGDHITSACAEYFTAGSADFAGLNKAGWQWVTDPLSEDYGMIRWYCDILGVNTSAPAKRQDSGEKTYVILTGSPKECGFATKKDFLAKHPEYEETTSWSKVQIVFTDDVDSTSSKAAKARKNNIPLMRYE